MSKEVRLTNHAKDRIKERFNITNNKEINRLAKNAFNKGKIPHHINDNLGDYTKRKLDNFFNNYNRKNIYNGKYNHKNVKLTVYSGYIFVFVGGKNNKNILVTTYPIPDKLRDVMIIDKEVEEMSGIDSLVKLKELLEDNEYKKKFKNKDKLLDDIQYHMYSQEDMLLDNLKENIDKRDKVRKFYIKNAESLEDPYCFEYTLDLDVYYLVKSYINLWDTSTIREFNSQLDSLDKIDGLNDYYKESSLVFNNIHVNILITLMYEKDSMDRRNNDN